MASTAPSELKAIQPWLSRASELRSADAVMAYWCSYHAAQLAMSLRPGQSDSKAFLFGLLDQLESSRKALENNDAVTDEAAGAAYVENFALKVFAGADAEDRAGQASMATAKRFLAAVNFLELLSNFGTLDDETQAKIKYSRWKAADIGKALREGRKPVPGPAGGIEAAPPPIDVDPSIAEADEVEKQLLGLTTNGAASGSSDMPIDLDSQPSAPPRGTSLPTSRASAPLEPSFGEPSFGEPEDEQPARKAPKVDNAGFPTLPAANGSAPALPPPPRAMGPRAQPPASAFPSMVLPSAPTFLPEVPPAPAPVAAPKPSAAFQASAPEPATSAMIDSVKVGEAQKHARWAISALNFDDLPTARKELKLALSLIGE